jgi:hypothetical protein
VIDVITNVYDIERVKISNLNPLAMVTEDVKEDLEKLKNPGTNEMYLKPVTINGIEAYFFRLKTKGKKISIPLEVTAFCESTNTSLTPFIYDYMCVYCKYGEHGMYERFEQSFGDGYNTALIMQFVFDQRRELKHSRVAVDESVLNELLKPLLLTRFRKAQDEKFLKFDTKSTFSVSGVVKEFFPFVFHPMNQDVDKSNGRLKLSLMTEDLLVDSNDYLSRKEMDSRILYSFVKIAAFCHLGKIYLSGCQMEHQNAKKDLVLCYCLNFTCHNFPFSILAYSISKKRYLFFKSSGKNSSEHIRYFTCLPGDIVPGLKQIMEGADRFLDM